MSIQFNPDCVYNQWVWTVLHADPEGYVEKFLHICHKMFDESEFPNAEISIDTYKTGGIFNREINHILSVYQKNLPLKNSGLFFRAIRLGNIMSYSYLRAIDPALVEGSGDFLTMQVENLIKNKCKNPEQWEEFLALNVFGEQVFFFAMSQLDSSWELNKTLFLNRIRLQFSMAGQ